MATLMFEPKSGLGVVVMTNEAGETAFNYGILSLLYGDYSESQRVKNTPMGAYKDISGIYTLSRTYENIFKVSIGQGTLTKVSDHQYIMDNENGWRYLMYETQNAKGKRIMQMMGSDAVKENTFTFGLKVTSLVLFIISILISIGKMFIHLIKASVKRIKKKDITAKSNICYIAYTAMAGVNCIVGFIFYRLIMMPLDGGSIKPMPVMIQCIILGATVIITIISTTVMIKQLKWNDVAKRNKRRYVLMIIMSCYIS